MNKKRILELCMVMVLWFCCAFNIAAAEDLTLTLKEDGVFQYNQNGQDQTGKIQFGDQFSGIAPGETRSASMNLKNECEDADFYISTKTISSFEEANAQGAAYSIKLLVGDHTIYDSDLGGYESTEGLGELDEVLKGYVFASTLKKGESTKVTFSVTLDGESVNNAYMSKEAVIDFDYEAIFIEPAKVVYVDGPVNKQVMVKKEVKYVKGQTVTIEDEPVPVTQGIAATLAKIPKTGDSCVVIALGVLLVVAVLVFVLTKKKTKKL